MSRNRKFVILIAVIVIVGIVVWLLFFQRKLPGLQENRNVLSSIRNSASPRDQTGVTTGNPVKDFLNAYRTPIEFYGKVVDQYGNTIGGATVKVLPTRKPFADSDESSDFEIISDTNGLFSVNNLKGLSLGIYVTKEGYLDYYGGDTDKPVSSRSIDYGLLDSKGSEFKDPKYPTLFTLHKLGPLEPIVYVEERRWRLGVVGTPREIALDSNDGLGGHQIRFTFTSNWNQLPKDNEINDKRFDWFFEARIPGGGFIKNDSDYNLEAPEFGYSETLKFEYPATMPKETWKKFRYGRYFVKFADGTHGRIRFCVDGDSDAHPLSMTSWMNLKPGSRNLASPLRDTTMIPEEE
jgi:hypothetical protein